MKTAVVYYSLDGNCDFVAQEIKNQLNADLLRLRLVKEKKLCKICKILWGVGMVMSGKKPPLAPYKFDASIYDLIILGAPVWASSPAPPLQTFISQAGITGKKTALFVCHGESKGDSFDKLKTSLSGNNIAGEIDFKNALKNADEVKRLITNWVTTL